MNINLPTALICALLAGCAGMEPAARPHTAARTLPPVITLSAIPITASTPVVVATATTATPPARPTTEQPLPLGSLTPLTPSVPTVLNRTIHTRSEVLPSSDTPSTLASLRALEPIQTSSQIVASIEPPRDLWERIRRGFAMPTLTSETVSSREQWYVNQSAYMQRMAERSRKYLFHIVEELEVRNMPTELALLPFIESAFNPQALSRAKAAGIWQFMPTTGKSLALKQNVFRDDRRDVLASTRAALDYLQKLNTSFGDWHLALAAYNWGEGNVRRAIAKNKNWGLGITYADLRMPLETQQYVPKLQAMKNIVANPLAFRTELPLIANHPYFQTVSISRDIDVALAAQLAEVKLADFKALNPSIDRPVILAAGTPHILLPWDNATVFQDNLEKRSGQQLASWTAWVAPKTLKPAEASKLVGMNETELRKLNNIPPRMLIKVGSTLLIARSGGKNQDVTRAIANNAQINLAPEIVLQKRWFKAGKNDSVTSIAKRYRLDARSVAQWNQVGVSAVFKAGQKIVLFLPAKPKGKATGRS